MTREQLYLKVWSTPMRTLAKEYGLSDVGLAKICKRYDIPRPSLGYWAKLQHGKKVHQPPLPKVEIAGLQTIHMHRYFRSEVRHDQEVAALEAKEGLAEQQIVVPETLSGPHQLVERTLKSLNCAAADGKGYVKPRAKDCLDVGVSKGAIDRAMRVIDALIKALERRGYSVSVCDGRDGTSTFVTVMGEKIAISLYSRQARKTHELTAKEKKDATHGWTWGIPKYDYFASDQLELRIVGGLGGGYWRSFGDSSKRQVESRLNKFIPNLLRAAEVTKAILSENERQAVIRREEERRRQEAAKAREQEEKYLKWLLAEADAWVSSQNIRAYLRAMRQTAVERHGAIHPESRLAHWLAWAEEQADRQDPLKQTPESPMDSAKPFSYSYQNDKFDWPRVENGIFMDAANAKAPPSEEQGGHDVPAPSSQ
jgi:hypothetical protein